MDLSEALKVEIPFGRHKGRTLEYVVETDIGYLGWLWDVAREQLSRGDFRLRSRRLKEAILVVAPEYEDEIAAEDEKKQNE